MGRVLVVEDEFVIALNASMLLEDEGMLVDTAYDGAEALEMIVSNPPSLIVTDYMMPVMDGLELITALRRQGWRGPIILATAISEDRLPSNYKGGHDAYISKPYMAGDFVSLVKELLARAEQ